MKATCNKCHGAGTFIVLRSGVSQDRARGVSCNDHLREVVVEIGGPYAHTVVIAVRIQEEVGE